MEGLRGNFEEGDRLLDRDAAEQDPRVRIRVDLERGRLRRSSGDKEAALPLFESAFAAAVEAGEDWLAGDAAHMCALAAPDRDGFVAWTNRGIELAEPSEAAAYWLGPLLNNLGWEHFDAGEHEQALDVFERALEVRERDPENPAAIKLAREAVEEARRALAEQLLEPLGVVERADHGEVRPVVDDVLRDALDVLGRDRVERVEHRLRLLRPVLEHLAPQPEHDRPVRALELEHEAALGEVARLLELVGRHRLRPRAG